MHATLRLFVIALIAALAQASASAQAPRAAERSAPAPLVAAPTVQPVVQPDGSVTFHLDLAGAHQVMLALEGHRDPIAMQADPATAKSDGSSGGNIAGGWSVTVPALAPEIYSYHFVVDGTTILDPHNTTIKTSFFSNDNVFLVPAKAGAMPWEKTDVPHGVVDHHYYHSHLVASGTAGAPLGIDSEYYVYTPPGFDPHSDKKYPVLYLLHGYSDEPSAWTAMGKANLILDNLIAQGKAKPMIVVMPWGYGDMKVITQGWASWRDPALVMSNFSRFGTALFQEVIPRVNAEYPLLSGRENHAIAGLSMGGAETLLVGLNHTDYFASIGSFSAGGIGGGASTGGPPFEAIFPLLTPQDAPKIQSSIKVLWIACGTEDGLNAPNQAFIAWLKEKGMQPTAIHTPGLHAWMVWRDNLSNFAPLLFQQ